jgi:hypothetical protein
MENKSFYACKPADGSPGGVFGPAEFFTFGDVEREPFSLDGADQTSNLMQVFFAFAPDTEEARKLFSLYRELLGEHDVDTIDELLEVAGVPVGERWSNQQVCDMYNALEATQSVVSTAPLPAPNTPSAPQELTTRKRPGRPKKEEPKLVVQERTRLTGYRATMAAQLAGKFIEILITDPENYLQILEDAQHMAKKALK